MEKIALAVLVVMGLSLLPTLVERTAPQDPVEKLIQRGRTRAYNLAVKGRFSDSARIEGICNTLERKRAEKQPLDASELQQLREAVNA